MLYQIGEVDRHFGGGQIVADWERTMLCIDVQQGRRQWAIVQYYRIGRTSEIALHHGQMLPGRVAIGLAWLGHQIAHIHTARTTGRNRILHTGGQQYRQHASEQ
jgi:hypothetical protein